MLSLYENPKAFSNHLNDAIKINKARKNIYAEMTGGQSLGLSRQLILFETFAKVGAWLLDRMASKFQHRGIPILIKDFVSMHSLNSPTQPPLYRNIANPILLKNVNSILSRFKCTIKDTFKRNDFNEAAKLSYLTMQQIKSLEMHHCCHFAMTLHLIESLGLAFLHAVNYAQISQGKTISLSKTVIRLHLLALKLSINLDRKAQAIHELNVGIIVNDVPHIPFEKEFLEIIKKRDIKR